MQTRKELKATVNEMKVLAIMCCVVFVTACALDFFKQLSFFDYSLDVFAIAYFSLRCRDICKLNIE